MRVAFDAYPLRPPLTGIGHYTSSLLSSLLRLESLEVLLFSLSVRWDSADALPTAIAEASSGSQVSSTRLSSPFRLLKFVPGRVKREALMLWTVTGWPPGDRLVGDVDVVHGTAFWVPPLKRRTGAVTIHDLTFHLYPEMCTTEVRRYRFEVPRVLRRCAVAFAPSQLVKNQLSEAFGFPRDQIVVTPEGVRGTFISAEPDSELEARMGIERHRYLLFAGTQEPRKNLDRLILSMKHLSDLEVKLVIAGPPGWGNVDLPALARKLNLRDRVVFAGYLSDRELGSLMAGAVAFVYPSIYEGFGLPPLEAMATGVAVVAAAAGSLPEVLGDAPFWCKAEDVESIATAIRAVVEDEPLREAAIEKGRAVVAKYSWDETARRTLEGYRLVIESQT